MEEKKVLAPLPRDSVFWEMWIWFKYSVFVSGIIMVYMVVRVNVFGTDMKLNHVTTPIMIVPNAYLAEPEALPKKK